MRVNNFEFSIGNSKIGNNTLIFNMGPASTCASFKLGKCTMKCYARKAERLYPQSREFRARQQYYWQNTPIETKCKDVEEALYNNPGVRYVRINESGDFFSQQCVVDVKKISLHNKDYIFYVYTKRDDLDFSDLPENLVVNGSNFMLDNQFHMLPRHADAIEYAANMGISDFNVCGGSCVHCDICKKKTGRVTFVHEH